jgi:hypothetical protein
MSTDAAPREEDRVSILSFDNLEEDYGLPGSDSTRIHHWLSQQCRFGLEEKELPGPYGIGGPGELLSTVLANHRDSSSTVSEEGGEAALRADSPLLGFGVDDERTLEDPLHFPSATYVRDLPDVCFFFLPIFFWLRTERVSSIEHRLLVPVLHQQVHYHQEQ